MALFRSRTRTDPAPRVGRTRYLVSTSGHPNYGDELITRAWLDFLAEREPESVVWLDCPHPGRSAHLFADTHPNLRTTSTLWELAMGSETHDPVADAARIARLVRDLGSPRFDEGLLTLRGADSLHLLGGGYVNSMWHDNLGLVSAAAEIRRAFDVPVFATGQGLMPLDDAHRGWLTDQFATFSHVEARDEPSAEITKTHRENDDAFLALALPRPVFAEDDAPERMVLVQGDLLAWSDEEATESIRSFAGASGAAEVGFAEAIPPDDLRYANLMPDARAYSFGQLWHDGLPARAGQRWLTTRFHAHLLAAAAGAAGTVIAGQPGYYDVKHASLLELGTGWNVVPAGTDLSSPEARPTVDPAFPKKVKQLAARKKALADRLYE
ncbi:MULTISPECIES: polysaccharide pyruvyl transferase family protein [unclassified Microbacterium]|uniref:polysaccharide pyruvyl transferase family protein n=1 Tax=unclassified Microbacterium TaxID=2609290 RepID=UPI00097ECA67|nr:polysaccharide pyruvyl transferase family protein [Microbacterium sp. JB110]RCS61492.1 polysaccharide pyruvyl transferase family protein [Microbacterium sp. JB110]SJM65828.1 hypothetical protein CZ774_13940 [Frigoribacterium sp. JB110]